MDMSPVTANPLDRAPDPKARASALLRCGIFLGLGLVMDAVLVALARMLLGPSGLDRIPGVSVLILVELIQAATTVVILGALVAIIYRESKLSFGLGRSDRSRQMGIGVLTGLMAMTVLIGLIAGLGGVRDWTWTAAHPARPH